mgnify:CR=1 FL=1
MRIAVPNKGSLSEPAVEMLRESGYRVRRDSKELIVADPDNDVEFFYLRPRDVAVYVGQGQVDAGITGRDLLLDSGSAASEVMGLGFAGSTFRFAGRPGEASSAADLDGRRVATSYAGLVRDHLEAKGVSAEVVRLDGAVETAITLGVADAAAAELERRLSAAEPVRLAVGTGRTLKAAIDKLPSMECPQHEIVSLTGSIAPDGSAAFFNVIFSLADKVKARSFPMPLPVIASSREERALLHSQPMIAATLERAAAADLTFLGIGDLGPSAPLFVDGFLTREELASLTQAGAVGEILGWAFDSQGRLIEGLTNERVASAPLSSRPGGLVVAIAKGENKAPGILAALKGGLVNGLLTDEATAARLLAV